MTQAIQQPVKVLGAGLAALAGILLNRGNQGIAIGEYLLAQGESQNVNSPVKLKLFYPEEKIEEIAKNPMRAYLNGHLRDLAHKVLAATAFYLTSSYSLVPESFKTAAWARVFFGNNFFVRFHIIDFAPVMLKLAHWCLDLKSIKERGQNGVTEYCKGKIYRLGKCAEVLYFGRLVVVGGLAMGNAFQISGNLALVVVLGSMTVACLGWGAASESFFSLPPSRLNDLESLSKAIEEGEWSSDALKVATKDLEAKLGREECNHVHSVILTQLEKKLETKIYPEWMQDTVVCVPEQEVEVRKIHGREGVYEEIGIPLEHFQYEMQQIRFAMMLLCFNLRRLDQDSLKYDAATIQKIQNFLYLQALYYPMQLIADFENGVEDRILYCYRHWKRQIASDQQQIKQAVARDPFFEPLLGMLERMNTIGLQKFTPDLQDLFRILENLLLNINQPRLSQAFKTDKTLYSTVKGAATKTLEEIVQICQQT